MTFEQTEVADLIRDTTSGALLNKNTEALQMYKVRKSKAQELEHKVASTQRRLDAIESSLAQMIELLQSMSKDRK